MGIVRSISLTLQEDNYLVENGISATEMMKTAIQYHKKGQVTLSTDILELETKLKRFQKICETQTLELHRLQEEVEKNVPLV